MHNVGDYDDTQILTPHKGIHLYITTKYVYVQTGHQSLENSPCFTSS